MPNINNSQLEIFNSISIIKSDDLSQIKNYIENLQKVVQEIFSDQDFKPSQLKEIIGYLISKKTELPPQSIKSIQRHLASRISKNIELDEIYRLMPEKENYQQIGSNGWLGIMGVVLFNIIADKCPDESTKEDVKESIIQNLKLQNARSNYNQISSYYRIQPNIYNSTDFSSICKTAAILFYSYAAGSLLWKSYNNYRPLLEIDYNEIDYSDPKNIYDNPAVNDAIVAAFTAGLILISAQYLNSYDQFKKSISDIYNPLVKYPALASGYLYMMTPAAIGAGIFTKEMIERFGEDASQNAMRQIPESLPETMISVAIVVTTAIKAGYALAPIISECLQYIDPRTMRSNGENEKEIKKLTQGLEQILTELNRDRQESPGATDPQEVEVKIEEIESDTEQKNPENKEENAQPKPETGQGQNKETAGKNLEKETKESSEAIELSTSPANSPRIKPKQPKQENQEGVTSATGYQTQQNTQKPLQLTQFSRRRGQAPTEATSQAARTEPGATIQPQGAGGIFSGPLSTLGL